MRPLTRRLRSVMSKCILKSSYIPVIHNLCYAIYRHRLYHCVIVISMLCVYCRVEFRDLPSYTDDNEVETLLIQKKGLHMDYLRLVTSGYYQHPIKVTSNIIDLIETWKKEPAVSIEGPKGSGKTTLCATLYQMLADDKNFDDIFLTCESLNLDDSHCSQYFGDLFARHKHLFEDNLNEILNEPTTYAHVSKILTRVSSSKAFRVFVDLSLFTGMEQADLVNFLNIVISLSGKPHRMLISVSSGIRHLTHGNKVIREKLNNILKLCHSFYITGFTKTEAQEYFTNDEVRFEDVYPFTGTNPHLLSLVNKITSISLVESTVTSCVKTYMKDNLGLDRNSGKLENHLKTQELRDTLKFSYCACRHGELNETEEHEYTQTWLAKHHLAVVEGVHTETFTIQDDRDDSIELKQTGTDVTRKILRWNFPTFGSMYLDVLRNFIDDCDSDKVKEICKKEPSFAGFWLEGMFVSHHKGNSATISVKCIEVSAESPAAKRVDFKNMSVAMLNRPTEVELGVIYELKRAHPIIDFAAHLTDNDNVNWLVFIQISLQTYSQHGSKLGDMFKRTSENTTNKSWSMYTHFRHLYSVGYSDDKTKVLLLYISPKDTDLEKIKSSVGKLNVNQKVYVGVLTDQASFYKEMKDFQGLRSI